MKLYIAKVGGHVRAEKEGSLFKIGVFRLKKNARNALSPHARRQTDVYIDIEKCTFLEWLKCQIK